MLPDWGRIRCQSCGEMIARKASRCSPRDRKFGVCITCLRGWEAKGFTHFDYGGVPLT